MYSVCVHVYVYACAHAHTCVEAKAGVGYLPLSFCTLFEAKSANELELPDWLDCLHPFQY